MQRRHRLKHILHTCFSYLCFDQVVKSKFESQALTHQLTKQGSIAGLLLSMTPGDVASEVQRYVLMSCVLACVGYVLVCVTYVSGICKHVLEVCWSCVALQHSPREASGMKQINSNHVSVCVRVCEYVSLLVCGSEHNAL